MVQLLSFPASIPSPRDSFLCYGLCFRTQAGFREPLPFAAQDGCVKGSALLRGAAFALCLKERTWGASLVAQWLRVRLPVQGTRARAPVPEDPTCRGAAGPVSHGR